MTNSKDNSHGSGGSAGPYERLIRIALSLSLEKDTDKLLEMILDEARAICCADAGTLYTFEEEERCLKFAIMQNDKLNIRARGLDVADEYPHIPLFSGSKPNHVNVSSYAALTGETVNIKDVYQDSTFDFEGPKTFDMQTGYRTSGMLVIPMKNHLDQTLGVLQLLNAKDTRTGAFTAFSDQDAQVVSALASLAAAALTKARLIEQLYRELDTIRRLKEKEDHLNKRLTEAVQEAEKANMDMAAALKRIKVIRIVSAAVFAFFLVAGSGFYGYHKMAIQRKMPSRQTGTGTVGKDAVTAYIVTPQPISLSVSLVGKLEPLQQVSIVSPFSGEVAEKFFEYGQTVQKGQLLLRMDTEELNTRIREATAKHIRAGQQLQNIRNWRQSTDVTQAERSLSRSRHARDTAARKLDEARILFDKGIISRAEYESAEESLRNSQLETNSAEDSLAAILEKGSPDNVRVAEFEFENANAELQSLRNHLAMAEVTSPVTGIILLPKAVGTDTKTVAKGVSVNQGELLVSVGDLEGYSVKCQVDEIDIGKIRIGQQVSVSGDAFPDLALTGKISHVSSQAGSSEGFSPVPLFDVIVTIESLTPVQAERLRLGMSCNLQVQVYNNPEALMVPIHMVFTDGPEPRVYVRGKKTGEIKPVSVRVGTTTMDAVEIKAGLRLGDTVVVPGDISGSGDPSLSPDYVGW